MKAAVLCLAAALAFASPALAAKDDLSPADLASLKGYTLDMGKINAMQAAMDEASKAGKRQQLQGTGDGAKNLSEMETNVQKIPGAMAIFSKHGLSAHDVVVMPFALMDAGMCVLYPSAAPKFADRVSPAQIAFYKQHQAELKKLKWLSGE